MPQNTEQDQNHGYPHFNKGKILDMAKKNGFKLLENIPFDEKGRSRPWYIDQKHWGGSIDSREFPLPAPQTGFFEMVCV